MAELKQVTLMKRAIHQDACCFAPRGQSIVLRTWPEVEMAAMQPKPEGREANQPQALALREPWPGLRRAHELQPFSPLPPKQSGSQQVDSPRLPMAALLTGKQ